MSEQTEQTASKAVVHITKNIVVVPMNTGQRTLKELRDAGFIPVQTADPASVRVVQPFEASGSDLLLAAMHGLTQSSYNSDHQIDAFSRELHRRLLARENL